MKKSSRRHSPLYVYLQRELGLVQQLETIHVETQEVIDQFREKLLSYSSRSSVKDESQATALIKELKSIAQALLTPQEEKLYLTAIKKFLSSRDAQLTEVVYTVEWHDRLWRRYELSNLMVQVNLQLDQLIQTISPASAERSSRLPALSSLANLALTITNHFIMLAPRMLTGVSLLMYAGAFAARNPVQAEENDPILSQVVTDPQESPSLYEFVGLSSEAALPTPFNWENHISLDGGTGDRMAEISALLPSKKAKKRFVKTIEKTQGNTRKAVVAALEKLSFTNPSITALLKNMLEEGRLFIQLFYPGIKIRLTQGSFVMKGDALVTTLSPTSTIIFINQLTPLINMFWLLNNEIEHVLIEESSRLRGGMAGVESYFQQARSLDTVPEISLARPVFAKGLYRPHLEKQFIAAVQAVEENLAFFLESLVLDLRKSLPQEREPSFHRIKNYIKENYRSRLHRASISVANIEFVTGPKNDEKLCQAFVEAAQGPPTKRLKISTRSIALYLTPRLEEILQQFALFINQVWYYAITIKAEWCIPFDELGLPLAAQAGSRGEKMLTTLNTYEYPDIPESARILICFFLDMMSLLSISMHANMSPLARAAEQSSNFATLPRELVTLFMPPNRPPQNKKQPNLAAILNHYLRDLGVREYYPSEANKTDTFRRGLDL